MLKLTVKKDYVIHLAQLCSVEASRRWLQGIYFETDSNIMVATDGHRLGFYKQGFALHLDSGYSGTDSGYIIKFNKSTISKLKKLPKKVEYIEFDIDERFDIKFEGESCGEIIDGTFPDWRRVCPQLNGADRVEVKDIAFNSQYLSSFGRFPHVEFYQSNGIGACIVMGITDFTNPDFVGVLMPMKV